jgi:hypothetical protein
MRQGLFARSASPGVPLFTRNVDPLGVVKLEVRFHRDGWQDVSQPESAELKTQELVVMLSIQTGCSPDAPKLDGLWSPPGFIWIYLVPTVLSKIHLLLEPQCC